MANDKLARYYVWDLPTRLFHWVNVLAIIGLVAVAVAILNAKALGATTDGKILLKTIHVWFGYVFILNLIGRLVWGFFGNRFARWRAILPGGRGYMKSLRSYVSSFSSGPPQHYLGHNPAGKIAVAVLLALMVVQGSTGLFLAGSDLFFPPFGHWIAQWVAAPGVDPSLLSAYPPPEVLNDAAYKDMRAIRGPIVEIHEYGFYILVAAIIVHIVAVVVTEVRKGGTLVTAMITGHKYVAGQPLDHDESTGA